MPIYTIVHKRDACCCSWGAAAAAIALICTGTAPAADTAVAAGIAAAADVTAAAAAAFEKVLGRNLQKPPLSFMNILIADSEFSNPMQFSSSLIDSYIRKNKLSKHFSLE